ncbi:MAG TPA: AAA family ATPase [Nocardioidaceae bacterium]|nr:AAA family ATPase [Nocardioidaceae bacterium]
MTTDRSESGIPDTDAVRLVRGVVDAVETVVVGKRDVIELVLMAVLARGHVLVEDVPGLGKTVLSRAMARALGLKFARVQFTPDLLPQDLTGTLVFDQRSSDFTFRPGPVFTQFLLADEINRTPPKTQAALLEAMAEQQVTTDGESRALPDPFFVMATSNPIEYEGTYVLPEAQLDRFVARIRMGYLEPAQEASMLAERLSREVTERDLAAALAEGQLAKLCQLRSEVTVHPDLLDYIVAVINATREHASVAVGASPRGGLAMGALAQAAALLDGRTYVLADDVKRVAVPALGHRLVIRPDLWATQITGDSVVEDVLSQVPTPRPEAEGVR